MKRLLFLPLLLLLAACTGTAAVPVAELPTGDQPATPVITVFRPPS